MPPFDVALLLPGQDGVRRDLGAVIADDHAGKALVSTMCDRARVPRWGGERGIDHQAEALPGEVIDHSEDAEAPAAHQGVP
jgi:hypothetical protein